MSARSCARCDQLVHDDVLYGQHRHADRALDRFGVAAADRVELIGRTRDDQIGDSVSGVPDAQQFPGGVGPSNVPSCSRQCFLERLDTLAGRLEKEIDVLRRSGCVAITIRGQRTRERPANFELVEDRAERANPTSAVSQVGSFPINDLVIRVGTTFGYVVGILSRSGSRKPSRSSNAACARSGRTTQRRRSSHCVAVQVGNTTSVLWMHASSSSTLRGL